MRSGLLFEARFRVTARQDLAKATLVLDPGWLEGMQANTIEPSPIGEGSEDGKLVLQLGHVAAGHSFLLFMQFQVDPTNVGRRSQGVALYDGQRRLVSAPPDDHGVSLMDIVVRAPSSSTSSCCS